MEKCKARCIDCLYYNNIEHYNIFYNCLIASGIKFQAMGSLEIMDRAKQIMAENASTRYAHFVKYPNIENNCVAYIEKPSNPIGQIIQG